MMPKTIKITLKEIITEFVDNGVVYPRRGYNELNRRPKSIMKATLSPTDKMSFSVSPSLFNLRMWRMSQPGTMVKKRNPKNCLKTGIFRSIARSVRMRNTSANNKNLFVLKVFDDSTIFIALSS